MIAPRIGLTGTAPCRRAPSVRARSKRDRRNAKRVEGRAPFAEPAKDAAPVLTGGEPQVRCCVGASAEASRRGNGRVAHPADRVTRSDFSISKFWLL